MSETPPPSYEEALYRNSVRLPAPQVFPLMFCRIFRSLMFSCFPIISIFVCSNHQYFCIFPYSVFLHFPIISIFVFSYHFPCPPSNSLPPRLLFPCCLSLTFVPFEMETQTRAVDVTMEEDSSLPNLVPNTTNTTNTNTNSITTATNTTPNGNLNPSPIPPALDPLPSHTQPQVLNFVGCIL